MIFDFPWIKNNKHIPKTLTTTGSFKKYGNKTHNFHKSVLYVDVDELLCDKDSHFLCNFFKKAENANVLIFYLSNTYDIVFLTKNIAKHSNIFDQIDPQHVRKDVLYKNETNLFKHERHLRCDFSQCNLLDLIDFTTYLDRNKLFHTNTFHKHFPLFMHSQANLEGKRKEKVDFYNRTFYDTSYWLEYIKKIFL